MPSSRVITGVGRAIPGATGVTLLARIRGANGQLVTRASLASLAYAAIDLTTGSILGSGSLAVSDVIFDSLVVGDYRWQIDGPSAPGPDGSAGYNFLAVLPASLFPVRTPAAPDMLAGPAAGHDLQADVAFTPINGQSFRQSWKWREAVVYG